MEGPRRVQRDTADCKKKCILSIFGYMDTWTWINFAGNIKSGNSFYRQDLGWEPNIKQMNANIYFHFLYFQEKIININILHCLEWKKMNTSMELYKCTLHCAHSASKVKSIVLSLVYFPHLTVILNSFLCLHTVPTLP